MNISMNPKQSQKFILSWAKLGRKEYLKDPTKCEVYLKRLQYFLDLIDNPEKKIPHYIHVTGTSGKGSICLMLDSVLRADKKRIGTMISPEVGPTMTRWQINGKSMSDSEFAKILTELKPKLAEYLKTSPYDPISHFELMTAIGLYWFAKNKIEWCILEVGCGGRYDSTNIIPYKDIAVITNIGLDHTEILGSTKEKIAYEKAGIIKRNCEVFTGESDKKVLQVIRDECKKQKVSLKILNFKFLILKQFLDKLIFKYENQTYSLPVIGEHQIGNAILAINITKSLKIPYSAIKQGLEKVKLPLRMEIISKHPLIILDGAHNPDKMKTTIETIQKISRSENQKINLIIGFSEDKDLKTMCQQLSTLKPVSIAISKFHAHFKQCADPKKIHELIKKLLPNTKIKTFSNSLTAYNWSKKQNKQSNLLLVTGSLYLSGEIWVKIDKMV